ncbi:MAG: nucleoside deaminase [Nitrospirae bacterium]|nr:nucleoside deaminase [Magnetococcales bacterium]
MSDDPFLDHDDALKCLSLLAASKAGTRGEVPVGAVLADPSGRIISETGNQVLANNDPLGHAELRAITTGAHRLHNYRLSDCRLTVSLQPCPMCIGAMNSARLFQWTFLAGRPQGNEGIIPIESMDYIQNNSGRETPFPLLFPTWSATLLRFFFESRR